MVVSYADPKAAHFYSEFQHAHTLGSVAKSKKQIFLKFVTLGRYADERTYEKFGWSW